MRIRILHRAIPQSNSLVVCSGTVTSTRVLGMGGGFNVFKKLFNQNVSSKDNLIGGWEKDLQDSIDDFNTYVASTGRNGKPMPSYQTIAKQDDLLGGVATVPCLKPGGSGTAGPDNHETYKAQYKAALQGAVDEARTTGRPLWIQPLGISGYQWPYEEAAQLFCDVLCEEKNRNSDVEITVDIHDLRTSDNTSRQFKAALITKLQANGIKIENEGASNKDIFLNIVDNLIENITHAKHGRFTAGHVDSDKVKGLLNIRLSIANSSTDNTEDWTKKIVNICSKKRHGFHFWATPASVEEFNKLLAASNFDTSGRPSFNVKSSADEFFAPPAAQQAT